MDPSQVLGWFNLPQRVLWALLLCAGLVLWGPDWFITGLGLQEFITAYRMWLGVVFLLLLAATLPTPIQWAASCAWSWTKERRAKKARRARLHNLSEDEKEVLRYYIANNVRTQTLDCAEGVAPALEQGWIIYRASNVSQGYTDFAYNIQQWALDYIRQHPEVLDAA
jgi:hypothetical protein